MLGSRNIALEVLLVKVFHLDGRTPCGCVDWNQVIATRVSTGAECSIIIEDGYVVGAEEVTPEAPKWKAGEF